MLITLVPVIVAIIGLVLYLATDGKLSEAGRIAFMVGLFFVVWAVAGKAVRL